MEENLRSKLSSFERLLYFVNLTKPSVPLFPPLNPLNTAGALQEEQFVRSIYNTIHFLWEAVHLQPLLSLPHYYRDADHCCSLSQANDVSMNLQRAAHILSHRMPLIFLEGLSRENYTGYEYEQLGLLQLLFNILVRGL